MLDGFLSSIWVQGSLDLPWWGYVLATLGLTHITIAAVTIFLHRHQAHRALDLHPIVSHFFRFWLWIASGMVTKEWVAIHRKHHAHCETGDDPHSPRIFGIRKVLWQGAELYRSEAANTETLERYGHGTPDDWLERHIYSVRPNIGLGLMAVIDLLLFGVAGIAVWAMQMIWIPFWAAGVINGLAHWWGYRNFESPDISRNLTPIGILIGGEEMHNNHHAFPSSARFSNKWWEFDIGWFYIRLMSLLGLARVKKVSAKPAFDPDKKALDMDTLRAVVFNRLHVMSYYGREVMLPLLKEEVAQADASCRHYFKRARRLLLRETSMMDDKARGQLDALLNHSRNLRSAFRHRQMLQQVWDRSAATHEHLLVSLQDWCTQAEASGIEALENFARRLRGFSAAPASV